jgi:hypothetical protein
VGCVSVDSKWGLRSIPGRGGGGDEQGGEEPNSRRVELRMRRIEEPLMTWRELRSEREMEWLVLGLARGFELGLVPTRSGSPIVERRRVA